MSEENVYQTLANLGEPEFDEAGNLNIDVDEIDLGDSEPERMRTQAGAPIVPAKHSTDPKYVTWIAEWRSRNRQKDACYIATQEMSHAFPELIVCRGWALYRLDLEWTKGYECWDQHWWCEAPDGTIVDPTCEQWLEPRGGVVYGYEKYDPQFHGPEPIGKCMECGALIFPGDWDDTCNTACSESCYLSICRYYNITPTHGTSANR